MSDKLNLTEEELLAKIEAFEQGFGEETPPSQCVSCRKPIHIKKKKCIFCGAEQPGINLFQDLID
ncbi:hypothetical protein ACFL6N_07530 [Thermodesulfobacteriota bacterium]